MKENKTNYKHFNSITTRWMDNDAYGHVNNVTYYSYFDTTINHFLINNCGLNIKSDPVIAYIVHSDCTYHNGISFPDQIEIGLRINKIGTTSVTYGLALFKKGEEEASVSATFIQVFVNRENEKPIAIPNKIKEVLILF